MCKNLKLPFALEVYCESEKFSARFETPRSAKLSNSHFLGDYTMRMKNSQPDVKCLHLQKYQIPISLGVCHKYKKHA